MTMAALEIKEEKKHILARPGVYNLGIWSAGFLPRWLAYGAAGAVADLSYAFYGSASVNLKANLARVFPSASGPELESIARKTFRNYSKYIVDYARFKTMDKAGLFKELVRIDGTERIDSALSGGRGLILLTAHLGNWELGGIFFGRQDIKINILTARDSDAEIHAIKDRYRQYHNIKTIVIGDGPFSGVEALNALLRNEVVAMLVDRTETAGVSAPFFGQTTSFPSGPLLLAAASGAPIMPAFVVRESYGYRAVAEELIYYDRARGDTDERVAASVLSVFERYIRQYADQWYNFVQV